MIAVLFRIGNGVECVKLFRSLCCYGRRESAPARVHKIAQRHRQIHRPIRGFVAAAYCGRRLGPKIASLLKQVLANSIRWLISHHVESRKLLAAWWLDALTKAHKFLPFFFFFLVVSLDISLWLASQTAATTNFLVTHPSTRFLCTTKTC